MAVIGFPHHGFPRCCQGAQKQPKASAWHLPGLQRSTQSAVQVALGGEMMFGFSLCTQFSTTGFGSKPQFRAPLRPRPRNWANVTMEGWNVARRGRTKLILDWQCIPRVTPRVTLPGVIQEYKNQLEMKIIESAGGSAPLQAPKGRKHGSAENRKTGCIRTISRLYIGESAWSTMVNLQEVRLTIRQEPYEKISFLESSSSNNSFCTEEFET